MILRLMFFYDIKVNVMYVYYFLKSSVKKDGESVSQLRRIMTVFVKCPLPQSYCCKLHRYESTKS